MARIKLVKLDIPYTERETVEKNYTVQQALEAASVRMNGRPICLDAIRRRSRDEKITLVELNTIADLVIDDTRYYAGM